MPWQLLQCDDRVDRFLAEVGVAAETRIRRDLRNLASKGNELRFPKTDSLGGGLFELRTILGTNIYRNIFIFRGAIIIILESFHKKSQKTPKLNMDNAKSRRKQIDVGRITPAGFTAH